MTGFEYTDLVWIQLLSLGSWCEFTGVEFHWSWGTAILALEDLELMRAPQQFQ